MDNKLIYHKRGKVYLEYEYWFFGFKRRGKKVLAELDWIGSDNLFAEYPKGLDHQLEQLVDYYRGLYYEQAE